MTPIKLSRFISPPLKPRRPPSLHPFRLPHCTEALNDLLQRLMQSIVDVIASVLYISSIDSSVSRTTHQLAQTLNAVFTRLNHNH